MSLVYVVMPRFLHKRLYCPLFSNHARTHMIQISLLQVFMCVKQYGGIERHNYNVFDPS